MPLGQQHTQAWMTFLSQPSSFCCCGIGVFDSHGNMIAARV